MSALNASAADQEYITPGDAAWILSNAFLIMTMQSGFGLLEAGYVSVKNITNIMVKNVVDVCLGGLTYWAFGYALSFGEPSNWFCGFGNFFATAESINSMGSFYTKYVFQFSFATAATTIVSGAVAERMKLTTYMVFSVLNTFVYCFPVAWAWNPQGFLYKMGFHDFAGACVVHMGGGASALVAAWMIGPRKGRFDEVNKDRNLLCSPVTALTGTFMLWWAWLAFNCGSTFAIEGTAWKVAAKVGVTTMNGSIGGGIACMVLSMICRRADDGRMVIDVNYIITGVLAGLVSVTACCAVISPASSILVGAVGAVFAVYVGKFLEWLHIDDPVGAIPVHFAIGIYSTVVVGLIGHSDFGEFLEGREGLLLNGSFDQLAVQIMGVLVITIWSTVSTFGLFAIFHFTIGYRVSEEEEELGADLMEHDIKQNDGLAQQMEKAFSQVISQHNIDDSQAFIAQFMKNLVAQKGNSDGQIRHLRSNAVANRLVINDLDGSFVKSHKARILYTKGHRY